jgi:hypothetical protein
MRWFFCIFLEIKTMMEMGISIFDWLWIAFIAVATAGSISYGVVTGRRSVSKQMSRLMQRAEHQRLRKKYWKARAKGKKVPGCHEKQTEVS